MWEVFAFLMILMILGVMGYFMWRNRKKMTKIEKVYNGTSERINDKMAKVVGTVNYNDNVLSNSQKQTKNDIDQLASELTSLSDLVNSNTNELSTIKADLVKISN
jgi:NADH:ubiquinone oxidoreductase subunit D